MDLKLGLIVLLASFQTVVPASFSKFDSQQCSQQCIGNQNISYQPGKTYVYDYIGKTRINSKDGAGPVIEIHAKAHVAAISACELSLQLKLADLKGLESDYAVREELEAYPILFSYQDGKVASVCPSSEDSVWSVNLKKAIISGLQISSLESNSNVHETDILGHCETSYELIGSLGSGRTLKKVKNLRNCGQRQASLFSLFPDKYSTDGVGIQNLPVLSNDHSCQVTLNGDKVVSKVECNDKATLIPFSWSQSTSGFESQFILTLEKSSNGISSRPQIGSINRQALTFRHTLRNSGSDKTDLIRITQVLQDICSNIGDEIRPSVPNQFAELVYLLRNLPQQSTKKLWQSVTNGEICPSSSKLQDIFTDALVMDGSEGSLKVIVEMINSKQINPVTVNYWLTLLAFANRPSEGSIKAVLPLIRNKELPRQGLLGVSALVHNFCADEVDCSSSPIVNEVSRILAQRIPYQCSVPSGQEDDVVVALRALANIAPYLSRGEVRSALECSKANVGNAIRVAAIETLQSMACSELVSPVMMEIFKSTDVDSEIRITAYKTLIQCPSSEVINQIIEQLQVEPSNQVGSYIVSHLVSMQKTSDPLKGHIRSALKGVDLPSKSFPKDFRKYSRYYEFSQHLAKINLGAVAEADVIFDGSFIPRSIKANLTLPMFGSAVNFGEIGIRQNRLESSLEGLFGPKGSLRGKGFNEILDELTSTLLVANDFNAIEANRYRLTRRSAQWPFKPIKLDSIVKKATIQPDKLEASVYLKIDGKYIVYLSLNDLKQSTGPTSKDQFKNLSKFDRAFSFMLMDSVYQFSGINGLPIKIDINSTAIFGFKKTDKAIFPSFATETSVKVGFEARTSQPGLKWVTSINSAPAIAADIEYRENRPSKVTFSLPKDTLTLFHFKSDLYTVASDNSEKLIQPAYTRHHDGCTKSFSKTLGLEICGEFNAPRPLFTLSSPFVPLNGPINFEVTLRKTDLSMKGWMFYLDLPVNDAVEVKLYRIGFLTPESSVDREFSAEFAYTMPFEGSRSVRASLKTPFKQIAGQIGQHFDDETAKINGEFVIDGSERFNGEVRVSRKVAGKKLGFDGEIRLERPRSRPVNIFGSVSIKSDRKSVIVFDFQTDKDPKRSAFIKGTVNFNLGKITSDIKGDLKVISFQLTNTLAKEDQSLQNDVSITYRVRGDAKQQQLAWISSIRGIQRENALEYNTKIEGTSSKWPQANFRLTWKSAFAQWQLIENDLAVEWAKTRNGFASKSKLSQVTRFSGFTGDNKAKSVQNGLTVDVAGFYYKADLNGNFEQNEQAAKIKFMFIGGDKVKTDRHQIKLEQTAIVTSPIKYNTVATVRLGPVVLDYVDSVQEKSPGQFRGNVDLKISGRSQVSSVFDYTTKSDRSKATRGMVMSLKVPSFSVDFDHKTTVSTTKHDLTIKTVGSNQGSKLWSIDGLVSRINKSSAKINLPVGLIDLELLPFKPNRIGYLKVVRNDLTAQTRVNLSPSSFNLEADARLSGSLYELSLRSSATDKWSFNIVTPSVKSIVERNPKNGKFDLKLNKLRINHLSKYEVNQNQMLITSETKSDSKSVAYIKAQYSGQDQRAALEIISIPVDFHSEVTLKSKLQQVEAMIKIKNSGRTYSLDATRNSTSIDVSVSGSGLFKVELAASPWTHLKIKSECSHGAVQTTLEVINKPEYRLFSLSGSHPTSGFEHSTLIQQTSEATTLFSDIQRKSKKIFFVNGRIADDLKNIDLKVGEHSGFGEWASSNGKGVLRYSLRSYKHETTLYINSARVRFTSTSSRSNRVLAKINVDASSSSLTLSANLKNDRSLMLNIKPGRNSFNGDLKIVDQSNLFEHATKVNYPVPFSGIDIDSRTSKSGHNLLTLKIQLAHQLVHSRNNGFNSQLTVQVNSESLSGTFQGKMTESEKQATLKITKPWTHSTEFIIKAGEINLQSITKRSSGQSLAEIDCKLRSETQSHLDVSVNLMKTRIEYHPGNTQSVRLTLDNGIGLTHETSASYEYRSSVVEVKSSTIRNNKALAKVNLRLDLSTRSFIAIEAKPWEVSFELDLAKSRSFNSLFALRNEQTGLMHNSKVVVDVGLLTVNSETKQNQRNLFSCDINFSLAERSEVKISSEKWTSIASFEITKSDQILTFSLLQNSVPAEYTSKLIWKSQKGLTIAYNQVRKGRKSSVDSEISLRSKSFLKFQSSDGRVDFDISPFGAIKSSKISIDWRPNSLIHNSEIKLDKSGLKVKSTSSRSTNQIYTFDGELGALESQSYGIKVDLVRGSSTYRHLSSYTIDDNSVKINSKSIVNRKIVWELNGVGSKSGLTSVDLKSSLITGKMSLDLNDRYLKVDATHKATGRRVTLQTACGPQILDSFSADFAWDAGRDPTARLMISRDSEVSNFRRDSINIEYGSGYKVNLKTKISSSILSGPHDFDLTFNLPRQSAKTISAHHEVSANKMACSVKFLDNGKIIHSLINEMSISRSRSKVTLARCEVTIKSTDERFDGIHLLLSNQHSASGSTKTELRLQPASGRPYMIEITSDSRFSQSDLGFQGKVIAKSPISGYQQQDASINFNWSTGKATLVSTLTCENGQAGRVQVKYSANSAEGSISVSLDGDLTSQLDGSFAQADYINSPTEKSASFKIDYKTRPLVAFSGRLSTRQGDIVASVSGRTAWTSEYSVSFNRIVAEIVGSNHELTIRRDNLELLATKLIMEDSKPLVVKAIVSQKGYDVFRFELSRYKVAKDEVKYIADYYGPYSTKVTLQVKKNNNLRQYQIEACPVSVSGCHVLKVIDSINRLERESSFNYQNGLTSQVYSGIYVIKSDSSLTQAKTQVSFNKKVFGYEIEAKQSGSANGKILIADRVIEVRVKSTSGRVAVDFLADATRDPSRKATLEVNWADKSSAESVDVNYKVKFGQSSLARPISASFLMKIDSSNTQKPFDSRIVLDWARDESKQIVIESYLENVNGNSANRSISFTVYQPNARVIDFGGSIHAGLTDSRFTSGLNWYWKNRQSVRKEGFNLLSVDLASKEISYNARCDFNDITAKSQWILGDRSLDLIGQLNVNGKSNKGQLSFGFEGKCAFAKVLNSVGLIHKTQACFEPYQLIKVTSHRYNGNSAKTDLSMIVSRRNGKVLKAALVWEPRTFAGLKSLKWPQLTINKLDFSEVPVEWSHKSNIVVNSLIKDIYQPLNAALVSETSEFTGEIARHSEPLRRVVRKAGQYLPEKPNFGNVFETITFNPIETITSWTSETALKSARYLRSKCSRNSVCYRTANAYERYGLKAASTVISEKISSTYNQMKQSIFAFSKNLSENYSRFCKNVIILTQSGLSFVRTHPIWSNQYIQRVAIKIAAAPKSIGRAIVQSSTRVYRSAVASLFANDDIRSLVNVISSLVREIRNELVKADLSQLSLASHSHLIKPSTWGASARYTVWNPRKGQIEAELVSPFDVDQISSALQSSHSAVSDLADSMKDLKSSLWNQLTPPFTSQAMLIGGQHFVTFDRRFYDFAGLDCSYLLARDFVNGNFSVIVKYYGRDESGIKKSLIVTLGDETVIEISPKERRVRIGKNQVELPVFLGSVSVLRNRRSIVVDDSSNGLTVECFTDRDLCSISISGWYFGRTKGMFGTYDYEPSNDFLLPHGRKANDPSDLAAGWEIEGSCQGPVQSTVRRDEVRKSSKAYRLCEKLFESPESPLSDGFEVVSPRDYFGLCLRHMAATKGLERPEKALCTIAAAYINSVQYQGMELTMPSECLTCESGEDFGSRSFVSPSGRSAKADVIFVVEERECNRKLVSDLTSLSRNIHKELEEAGLEDPRFGLIGFGSTQDSRQAHGHTARGELFFHHHDIVLATKRMELVAGQTYDSSYSNVFEAIALASQYPFRKGASKTIVLVTCNACNSDHSRLDYNDIQQLLLTEGITLHVISNQQFEVTQKTSKTRDILGIDARSVQRLSDIRSSEISEEQIYLRRSVIIPKDVCIALAHLSNGSFYPNPSIASLDHRSEKLWSIGLARRLASTAIPHSCQHCDCLPDNDLLHSRTVCRPCRPLKPVY